MPSNGIPHAGARPKGESRTHDLDAALRFFAADNTFAGSFRRDDTIGLRSPTSDRLCGLVEPARRVLVDDRGQSFADSLVIGVEPTDLLVFEQRRVDQIAVDRSQSKGLETQHVALGRALRGRHREEVVDPDAISAGLVIAGLVRDDHPGQQRLTVCRLRDTLRAFVHAEIAADTVPGAVVVIEPPLPERPARETVELCPGGPLRKARQRQRNVAFEHAGEAVAHFGRGLADRNRPRYIGRSVEILGARIEEIEGAGFEALFGFGHRPIVDDRAVRAGARDRREAQIAETLTLAADRLELVAGGDLGEPASWRLLCEPSEKTRQRRPVAAMRRPRAVEFGLVFTRLWQEAGIGGAIDLRSRCVEPVHNPCRSTRRIDLHAAALSGELVECRSQPLARRDRHAIAEMTLEARDELAPVDKQGDRTVLPQNREG